MTALLLVAPSGSARAAASDLDPALFGYAAATVVAVFGVTWRASAFWRRPASAVYGRALLAALARPAGFSRDAPLGGHGPRGADVHRARARACAGPRTWPSRSGRSRASPSRSRSSSAGCTSRRKANTLSSALRVPRRAGARDRRPPGLVRLPRPRARGRRGGARVRLLPRRSPPDAHHPGRDERPPRRAAAAVARRSRSRVSRCRRAARAPSPSRSRRASTSSPSSCSWSRCRSRSSPTCSSAPAARRPRDATARRRAAPVCVRRDAGTRGAARRGRSIARRQGRALRRHTSSTAPRVGVASSPPRKRKLLGARFTPTSSPRAPSGPTERWPDAMASFPPIPKRSPSSSVRTSPGSRRAGSPPAARPIVR